MSVVKYTAQANSQLIAETASVCQQHPQRHVVLPVDQSAIVLQNLDLFQLGSNLVQLLMVIQILIQVLKPIETLPSRSNGHCRCASLH